MYIKDRGNPSSKVWVITDTPLPRDNEKGYLFSSGMGEVFNRMMVDALIPNYYTTCYRPDTDDKNGWRILENEFNHYKPPIIIALDHIGYKLLPEMEPKFRTKTYDIEEDSQINVLAGSLLCSDSLGYPHYIIPTYGPEYVTRFWRERDIAVSIDLGKAREELKYFENNKVLQPLPVRDLKYQLDTGQAISYLEMFLEQYLEKKIDMISVDIETIYPKAGDSYYDKLPGYPITIGIGTSPQFGISFNLFKSEMEDSNEELKLWRRLSNIFKEIPQLGQNYFNFDASYLTALGFTIDLSKCHDTLIRHHVLWPELKHKLQFQTRQYTREPYYKDTGKSWSPTKMENLRRYNCLDVCVTKEIYDAQEEEFNERPWLR